MTKQLLLTFDYELFLGSRSGTVEKCLINPTELLLGIATHHPLKMVFFVDTLYLIRLTEQADTALRCADDRYKIIEQLRNIVKAGHYLFPHLHPHWLDAVYLPEENQWRLDDPRFYRLHQVDKKKRIILFAKSIELLTEIVRSAGGDYSLDAYRAGGWSIQPFGDFAPLFREFGIRYDFSVAARHWSFTDAHWYDFTTIRDATGPYRFSTDVTIAVDAGEFIEFPISYLEIGALSRRLDTALQMTFYRRFFQPSGKGEILQTKVLEYDSNQYQMRCSQHLASPEYFRCSFMPEYYKFVKENDYLHFISHPKLLTNENLFWLSRLLGYLFRNFEVESDFRNINT